MNERLLTVGEVAVMLALNPQTVRRWLREGRLRGLRTGEGKGADWRVPESAIAEMFAPNAPKPA